MIVSKLSSEQRYLPRRKLPCETGIYKLARGWTVKSGDFILEDNIKRLATFSKAIVRAVWFIECNTPVLSAV